MSGRPSTMDTFMDAVKAAAERAGNAASLAGQRAKLRTEILLADRNVTLRKRAFGAEMYDHVAPLTDTQDFYASNDTLMETLRPPLLSAHREILALNGRRGKLKEAVNAKQVERTGAFPVPATTWSGKVWNAGKATGLAGAEAKLRTDLAAVERQILGIKEDFGEELYGILVDLEEKSGWLPTDRDVRAIYDQCRRDIDNLEKGKKEKMQQLVDLGGTVENYNAPNLDASVGGSGAIQQQQQQRPIDAVQEKPLPVSTGGGAGPPSVFRGPQQQQQQQGFGGAQTVGAPPQQQPAAPDPSLDVFGAPPAQIQPQRQDPSSSQGFGGGANTGAPYSSHQQGGFHNGHQQQQQQQQHVGVGIGASGAAGGGYGTSQQNVAQVDQQQQGWNTIFGVSSGAGNSNGGGSFSQNTGASGGGGGGGGGGFGISQQRALNALAGSSTARSVAAAGVSQMAKSAVAGNGFGGGGSSSQQQRGGGSSSNNAGGNNPPRDLLWD